MRRCSLKLRSSGLSSGSGLGSGGLSNGSGSGGQELLGLEAVLYAIRSGTFSKIHSIRAAPGLSLGVMRAVEALVTRVSRTVKTARLLRLGVEAVGLVVFRRARFESSTTSISASVTATTTDRLIGLVSGGRTTTEAKAFNRGLDQLVRLDLRLGGGIAGRSQESDRGDGSEKHLVDWDLIVEVEIGLYDLICQTRNKATNRV